MSALATQTALMPESQQQYGSILTIAGETAEQNSKLLKKNVEITHIAFGDANDTYVQPSRTQTGLVNEIGRLPVNSVDVMQATPESVPMLRVEAIVPPELYDIVIREHATVATFNGNTFFHAVGNCARVYVPPPVNNGNMPTPVTLEMFYVITSAEAIVEIEARSVHASREFVYGQVDESDDRLSKTVIDQNGKDWFIDDGFLVTPSAGVYDVNPGVGYVSGYRVVNDNPRMIEVPDKPSFIYVDAWREGTQNKAVQTKNGFVVSADELDDYTDVQGTKHFVCKIAQVIDADCVVDLRPDSATISSRKAFVNGRAYPEGYGLSVETGNVVPSGTLYIQKDGVFYSAGIEVAGEVTSERLPKSITIGGQTYKNLTPSSFDITVSDITKLEPSMLYVGIHGSRYVREGDISLDDGPSFKDGAIYLTNKGVSFRRINSDGDIVHLKTLGHVKGTDAAKYIDAATLAGMHIDIAGWQLMLDGGYELRTVILGKGIIKQSDGDEGVSVLSGGGFYGGVTFDGEMSDKKRPVSFDKGAIEPFADDLTVRNYQSSTFINALFVDIEGVSDFRIKRFKAKNLYAKENGIPGDPNGLCRGINVAPRTVLIDTNNISSGSIDGVKLKDFSCWEDCDGVAIHAMANGVTYDADITVSRVVTKNVMKRAIKVQANNVPVRGARAHSDHNDEPMYAVVSYYGTGGTVYDVEGTGAINNGVDVNGFAIVRDVRINSKSTYENGGAIQVTKGGCIGSSIVSNGLWHVLHINAALGEIHDCKFSDVSGSSLKEPVYFKPKHNILSVALRDADLLCVSQGVYGIAEDVIQPGYLNKLVLSGDINISNDHYFNALLQKTKRLEIVSARCGGDSVGGYKLVGGEAFITDVASNKTLTVELERTVKAHVVNVEGKLRLQDTDNTNAALCGEIEQSGENTNLKVMSW